MPLSSLTAERLAALQGEHDSAAKQLALLERATPESLWLDDLTKVEAAWNSLTQGGSGAVAGVSTAAGRKRKAAKQQHAGTAAAEAEAEGEEDEVDEAEIVE